MDSSAKSCVAQSVDQDAIDKLSRIILLDIANNILSEIGSKENRDWREPGSSQRLVADASNDSIIAACKIAIKRLFETVSLIVENDILCQISKVEGDCPKAARDSVLSWIDIVETLIPAQSHSTTVPYTPADFKAALGILDDHALGDFLWATDRQWIRKTPRGKSIERLMAMALARSLRNAGHDANKVDNAMRNAFGVNRDAMRKWEAPVRQELGAETVDNVFGQVDAGHLFPLSKDWISAQPFIHTAGSAYRRGIGHRHLPEMTESDSYQRKLDELREDDADSDRAPSND